MITDDLLRLQYLNMEIAKERKHYRKNVKPLRDEKRILEASIAEEVLKSGKTIQIENIRAEYKPTVVIEMIKTEHEND